MKILITGMGGTGKTAIAERLKNTNNFAVDLDATGFCSWVEKETGKKARHKKGAGSEWLKQHSFRCDVNKLRKFLEQEEVKCESLFICGKVSKSQIKEIFDMFDMSFVLLPSDKVLRGRLLNRTNKRTDFGKEESEIQNIIDNRKKFESTCLNNGAIGLNNNNSLDGIIKEILDKINPLM